MRIIFFGDSLTWGGYGGNFVKEVAAQMPEHEIINAGVGGNTVVNLLRRIDDDVIDRQPDVVFVMIGGNDSISYSQPATRPYYKKAQDIPDGVVTPDLFRETYRELLTKLQLAHIHTFMGLAPAEYNSEVVKSKESYNAMAAEIARSMNIPVLDLQPHFNPKPEEMKDRPPISLKFIDTIGRRSSSGWDDYQAEREREGYTYSFDGLHFTPESVKQVADLIVPFLRENL